MIRSRLFEALAVGETKIGDLLKAAIAEKSLSESQIKVADWEQKRKAALDAVSAAETTADPESARRKLAEEIRAIYGLVDAETRGRGDAEMRSRGEEPRASARAELRNCGLQTIESGGQSPPYQKGFET
jgi:hypothetical protein